MFYSKYKNMLFWIQYHIAQASLKFTMQLKLPPKYLRLQVCITMPNYHNAFLKSHFNLTNQMT